LIILFQNKYFHIVTYILFLYLKGGYSTGVLNSEWVIFVLRWGEIEKIICVGIGQEPYFVETYCAEFSRNHANRMVV